VRWSTAVQFLEVGLQATAGLWWMPFPPVEIRARASATPYRVWGRPSGPVSDSDQFQFEGFAELVFRVDR
jgi:hypothetical protein